MTSTIVMVHGAFCGGWVFDAFRAPFEAAGYKVLAPDLLGHAPHDPPRAVEGLSMADYAGQVAEVCAGLGEAPVLLGHSLGGLVAQLAARRTKVKALVLLAPSPPWGVVGTSMEEAATAVGFQMLGSFWSGALSPDASLALAYTLDRLSPAEQQAALARLRPESGRALAETVHWWFDPAMITHVGAALKDVPTLFMVGEHDRVHPPATVRDAARRLGADCRVLPSMSHWLPAEPGWTTVAAGALRWLNAELSAAA